MKPYQSLLIVLGCALSFGATAQWQWLDKSGRKVFSDRGPPPEIPAKNILKYPGSVASAPAEVTPPASTAIVAAPKISGVDKALEEKKKQIEQVEAASRKAELDKNAIARADNCKLAKQSQLNFDSGVRIARTNDKGEREILDDAARTSELNRIRNVIATDCK